MTRSIIIALLLCTALPAVGHSRVSDISCDDSTRLEATLKDVIGAERQAMGMRDPETLLEVWVTEHNGDWMIVQNYANGTSCIVAMGEHWEASLAGPA